MKRCTCFSWVAHASQHKLASQNLCSRNMCEFAARPLASCSRLEGDDAACGVSDQEMRSPCPAREALTNAFRMPRSTFDSPLPSVFVSHRSDVTSNIWGFMLDTSSVYKKAVHTRQRAPINVRCATGAARPRGHAHDNRASGFRAAPARIVDARRRPPTALLRPVGGGCGTFGSVGATAWEASVGTASVAAAAGAGAASLAADWASGPPAMELRGLPLTSKRGIGGLRLLRRKLRTEGR